MSAFEELLTFPKRTRMPNLLLCGPTNNGKSMVLEKFRRAHPPVAADVTSEGVASIPVLKIKMPLGPDERRFETFDDPEPGSSALRQLPL